MSSTPHPRPWIQEAATGFLVLLALLVIAACKVLRWCWLFGRRAARALILAFCTPRPIDGRLYEFCHSQE
jgi:hypothetical protein